MGMPRKLLTDAKKLGIYTIFLTHNYFPFCPKSSLFFNHSVCDVNNKHNCTRCCEGAYSKLTLFLLHSHLYSKIKRSAFAYFLRNKFFAKESIHNDKEAFQPRKKDDYFKYEELQSFYLKYFDYIDLIICNSYISKDIYQQGLPNIKKKVIPLTHLSIRDNRHIRQFSKDVLTIGYLGPANEEKGFFFLIHVLDRLFATGKKFKLVVYGYTSVEIKRDYLIFKGKYSSGDLQKIYSQIDCTIVPSQWKETYGFTVLESLSNGVPTLASSNVGASMLLDKYCLFTSEDELFNILNSLNCTKLEEMNNKICKNNELSKLIHNGLTWL